MEEQHRFIRFNFMQAVGERRLQRLYPWILGGLSVLYLGTFTWLSPMAVAIPVTVAGWFYYKSGAIIASAVAFLTNAILVNAGLYALHQGELDLTGDFLFGHVLIGVAAVTVGYF